MRKTERIKIEEDSEDLDRDFLIKRKERVISENDKIKIEVKYPEELITNSWIFNNKVMKFLCRTLDKEDEKIRKLRKYSSNGHYVEHAEEVLSSCYLYSSISSFEQKMKELDGNIRNRQKNEYLDLARNSSLSDDNWKKEWKKKTNENTKKEKDLFENNEVFIRKTQKEYKDKYEKKLYYLINI
jgi:hypothetical protein